MAKGQMRSNKEKKKPKQDKNKKDKGAAVSPFNAGQGQPGQNPYGKKGPGNDASPAGRGSKLRLAQDRQREPRTRPRCDAAAPTRRYSVAMILPAAE